MSGIDIEGVASEAANRMIAILTGAGKEVIGYAEAEARKLATSAAEIAALRASGQIDDEEARLHLDIQKHASRAVLMAIKGVSLLAAEQAINAGLQIILGAVRGATGLNLFPGA
jgi:signal transduction protein with GAF and PtsI domain